MRTILASAAIAAFLVISQPSMVVAQNPASANVSMFRIAVVDISYVFKNDERFKATMESLKGEMQRIDQELKGEMEKLRKKEGQRNQFDIGSPEWKQTDNELTQLKANFNVLRTQRQKEFVEKEAKVYYQTYLKVNEAVRVYAQQQKLGLVLRFNGDPVDKINSNRREEVMRALMKPVVFQNQIDITPDIIAIVNRGVSPSTTAPSARGAALPGIPSQPPRRRQ